MHCVSARPSRRAVLDVLQRDGALPLTVLARAAGTTPAAIKSLADKKIVILTRETALRRSAGRSGDPADCALAL